MTTETVATPSKERTDDPDLVHLYCCRPWLAMCGERLTGKRLGYDYPDSPDDCVVCLDLQDEPCSFPGCRIWSGIRYWWRDRRSS